jgi:hypothetical protein
MSIVSVRHWYIESVQTLPPSRMAGCMAYDGKRHKAILFGGCGYNDTWAWDGTNWQELHPATRPPARTSGSMVYDKKREEIVMFGGFDRRGLPLNDTWIWNGKDWRMHHTPEGLIPRGGASMAYDSSNHHVFLFGGQTNGGRIGRLLNDTWVWDGGIWRELKPKVVPPNRHGAMLSHHTAKQNLVLFGGSTEHGINQDTWIWDGKNWREHVTTSRPPARAWANLIYHHITQQIVLVGGGGHEAGTGIPIALSDTWVWDGGCWEQLLAQGSPAGSYHCSAYDMKHNNIIVYAASENRIGPMNNVAGDMTTQESKLWIGAT